MKTKTKNNEIPTLQGDQHLGLCPSSFARLSIHHSQASYSSLQSLCTSNTLLYQASIGSTSFPFLQTNLRSLKSFLLVANIQELWLRCYLVNMFRNLRKKTQQHKTLPTHQIQESNKTRININIRYRKTIKQVLTSMIRTLC